MYQTALRLRFPGTQTWVQTASALALWMNPLDEVTGLMGQLAGVNLAGHLMVEASAEVMRPDPVLAFVMVVMGAGVMFTLTS